MELLLGQTATAELLTPAEIRIALGTCLLAMFLLLGAWISGRRNPIPAEPWIARPRTAGLRFSIAAAAGNLAIAGVFRWLGSRNLFGVPESLPIFAAVWYLLILPLQILAGFHLGRACRMPGRRGEPAG